MAKGFGVLLVLFGALVCVHQRNEGVFVGEVGAVSAVAPEFVSSVVYAERVEGYMNAADRYVNADGLPNGSASRAYTAASTEFSVNPADAYMNAADPYVNAAGELVKASDVDASARDRLQQIYLGEVGVRERTGRNDGHRVAEYLRYTDLGEGYAWCASFVSWVYGRAGYSEPRTAWSPALFPAKRVIWEKGDSRRIDTRASEQADAPASLPQKGDVFGIYFTSVKRIAHAGFVDEWGDKYVVTVEGNTNEAGSREGDGVYRKRRLISSIYRVSSWF